MQDDAERARATLIRAMEHDKRSQRRIAAGYSTSITSDEAIKAIMLAQQPEGWRERVRPYLQHSLPCRMNFRMGARECTCGLSAMLDAAPIPGEE